MKENEIRKTVLTIKELRDFIQTLPNDTVVKVTEDDCEYPICAIGYGIKKDNKSQEPEKVFAIVI